MKRFTSGIEDVVKKLGNVSKRYQEATEVALYAQAIALDELVNRAGWVPMKTGALRASHYVTPPEITGGKAAVEVGYGVDYAPEVHEREQNAHVRMSSRKGQTKWMERAMSVFARAFNTRLYENILAVIKSGATKASLAGAVPTSPQITGDGAQVDKYRAKYGHSKSERKVIRQLAKAGHVKLVRRWKRKRKKV
jgi:hypothetical protein